MEKIMNKPSGTYPQNELNKNLIYAKNIQYSIRLKHAFCWKFINKITRENTELWFIKSTGAVKICEFECSTC